MFAESYLDRFPSGKKRGFSCVSKSGEGTGPIRIERSGFHDQDHSGGSGEQRQRAFCRGRLPQIGIGSSARRGPNARPTHGRGISSSWKRSRRCMSVLLPAPVSPITPGTRPTSTRKLTPSRARTAGRRSWRCSRTRARRTCAVGEGKGPRSPVTGGAWPVVGEGRGDAPPRSPGSRGPRSNRPGFDPR